MATRFDKVKAMVGADGLDCDPASRKLRLEAAALAAAAAEAALNVAQDEDSAAPAVKENPLDKGKAIVDRAVEAILQSRLLIFPRQASWQDVNTILLSREGWRSAGVAKDDRRLWLHIPKHGNDVENRMVSSTRGGRTAMRESTQGL